MNDKSPAKRNDPPSLHDAVTPPARDPSEPEVLKKAADYLRPHLLHPAEADRVVAQVVAASETFRGPLPHPRHLKDYDDIVPGSAAKIINMAYREQSHRHKMQWMEMIYQ